jgi:hypothetical protein
VEPSTHPIVVASILHYCAILESIRQLGLPNPVIALRPVEARCVRGSHETL